MDQLNTSTNRHQTLNEAFKHMRSLDLSEKQREFVEGIDRHSANTGFLTKKQAECLLNIAHTVAIQDKLLAKAKDAQSSQITNKLTLAI